MTDKSSNYLVSLKLQAEDMVSGVVKKILGEAQAATGQTHGKSLSRVQEIGKAWQGVTRSITSTFSGIRNTLGAVNSTVQAISGFGIRDIAGSFLNASVDMENVQLSIATLLQTVDMSGSKEFANFNKAQEKTISLMQTMRDEAAKTPVEFEDIAGSFQQIMPLARDLGVSLEEIVKLSGATATWDRILGKSGVSATDIRQLLGGQNSIVQINNPLLKKNLEELKKYQDEVSKDKAAGGTGVQAQAKMLKRIVAILGISDEANAAWEKSFDGRMNNLKSVMKMMVAEGSSPIFEQLKGAITGITQWMQKHPAEVKATVEKIASTLWGVVQGLYEVMTFIVANWKPILVVIGSFVGVWALSQVGMFIKNVALFANAITGGALADFMKWVLGGGILGKVAPAAVAAAATTGAAEAGVAGAATGGAAAKVAGMGFRAAAGIATLGFVQKPADTSIYNSDEDRRRVALCRRGFDPMKMQGNPYHDLGPGAGSGAFAAFGDFFDKMDKLAEGRRVVSEVGLGLAMGGTRADKIRAELNITVKSDGSLGIESASADGMNVKVQNRGASTAGTNAGGQ